MAASFIRRLKPVSQAEREAALVRTFGCPSPEEADEMERVIGEGCEQSISAPDGVLVKSVGTIGGYFAVPG